MVMNLRPIPPFGAKHGLDAPPRAEHVEGFGEAVIVDHSSVDGKYSH